MEIKNVKHIFGIVIGKPGNVFAPELGEWKTCHKLIQNAEMTEKVNFQFFQSTFVSTLNLRCLTPCKKLEIDW